MEQPTESKSKIWSKIFWSIIVGSTVSVITGVIANHVYWVFANQNKLYYTLSHDNERTRFTLALSNKTKKDIEQLKITLAFKDKLQRARIFTDKSLNPVEIELDESTFIYPIHSISKDKIVKIDIDSQVRGNSIKTKPIIEGKCSIIAESSYKIWTVEGLITIIAAMFTFFVIALIIIIIVVIRELRRSRKALKERGIRHGKNDEKVQGDFTNETQ